MEDPGRMEHRHWPHFDHNHMKDYLKDHPALRLMETLAQRDAAYAERDTALAEKKTAYAERDAALLQRDVAYADRNTAWMERDTALTALTMLRANKDCNNNHNNEAAAKLMHMVNINVNPFVEPVVALPPPPSENMPDSSGKKQQGKKPPQEGAKKRKRASKEKGQNRRRGPKSAQQKMDGQEQLSSEVVFKMDGNQEDVPQANFNELVPFDLMMSTPIPYCSCSGANQQCYRWGNGGWQSACCTNVISMYPLPMSPTKRGARVPGRKMSGGAFKKILEKIAMEGMDITMPIDLKNHWAKHGTNRYVTIK